MSVLNLSEVRNENDTFRFDSEYFKKEFLDFFKNIKNIILLGACVKDGYRVVYENTKIVDNQEGKEKNYPYFIQATDLQTPFIDTSNLFYVNQTEWERYPKGRIKKGEILIEVKGKVDKVAIVEDDIPEKSLVSGSLFKLTANDKISKNVLLVYLISKYGVAFKDRFKTNLLISYISKPDLYRIPIPIFDKVIQTQIDSIFEKITSAKNISKQKYTEAENLLLETLNLKDFQPNNEAVNIKTLKESFLQTGRLDAEFYQKKYEEIEQKIQNYIEGYAPLGKVCTLKDTNFTPNDNTEYAYIELSNIGNSGEITGCTREMGINLPTRARRKVSENDVIVSSIEGSLKSCAIISKEYHNALCSTGFYVVASEQINAETLLILFKSELMQQILKKNCSGTILTAINKEEFLNIPIPIIGKKYQEQIAEYIQKANQLRTEAQSLLQEAKLSVESAIESQLSENQNISGGG